MQPIEKTVEQKSHEKDFDWGSGNSKSSHGIPRSILPGTIFSIALFVLLILFFVSGDM